MTSYSLRHQILTLHYIIQISFKTLHQLLKITQMKSDILQVDSKILATLFKVSEQKVAKIKQQFYEYLPIPFEHIYLQKNYIAILFDDPDYPTLLRELANPPAVLYCYGDIKLLNRRKIAIIGSRQATSYTERALNQIIPPLVKEQFVVVSGFAKGADTIAFKSTLHFGGQTIAILGSGFDHIYPRQNQQFFEHLQEGVCFISEYPPYMEPKKWNFPMRNRLISGMSEALVVTEAAMRSGTMITTDLALEQGKDVFVVPGPINSPFSEGTNTLIKDGAIPIWNGYQIVHELN